MAFNPFDAFRKNSKPMLAALTIFVMIVFVLSTGGGGSDFFDWIARQFGGKDSRGAELGEIDGSKYYAANLDEIRKHRMAANSFMINSVGTADNKMFDEIMQQLNNNSFKDQITPLVLRQCAQAHMELHPADRQFRQDPRQILGQANQYLGLAINQVKEKDSPAEFRALRNMAKIIAHDARPFTQPNGLYFTGVANRTEQDALQFAMYLRLADQIGLKFSSDDLKNLIGQETDNQLNEKDASAIDLRIRQQEFRGLSAEQLFKAIGDEFRVSAVLKMFAGGSNYDGGKDLGVRDSYPSAMTPFEFFDFYKDRCSELTFELIDIDVENFMPLVKDEPTDKQMKEMFDRYRNVEFNPERGEPGFKEGRGLKLQYVGLDASLPIYKKAILEVQAASTIAAGFNSTYLGGGPIPTVMQVAAPEIAESLRVRDAMSSELKFNRNSSLFEATNRFPLVSPVKELFSELSMVAHTHGFVQPIAIGFFEMMLQADRLLPVRGLGNLPLRDSSTFHPLPFAGLTAHLAAGPNIFGGPVAAMTGARDLAELIETRDRVRFGMQMVVSHMSFNPLYGWPLLGSVLVNAPSEMEGLLYAKHVSEENAKRPQRIAEKDMESLRKKLDDIRAEITPKDETPDDPAILPKKKEPAKIDPARVKIANEKAEKAIAEWIAARPGVLNGKSANILDRYNIADDPGIATLRAKVDTDPVPYRRFTGYVPPGTNVPHTNFFPTLGPKETSESQLFSPVYFPTEPRGSMDFAKPVFLAWRIEDIPAKSYGNFNDLPPEKQGVIRARVVRAWKMEKARALATKAAEDFATEVRALGKEYLQDSNNLPGFEKGLREKVAAHKYASMDQAKVVPLEQPRSTQPFMAQASGYSSRLLKNDKILYIDPMMPYQMLDIRDKPLGEVLVAPNVPKSHFYIAVMSAKQQLRVEDFARVFSRTTAPPRAGGMPRTEEDTLYQQYARMDALRNFISKDFPGRLKAETKFKETEAMKKQIEKPSDSASE